MFTRARRRRPASCPRCHAPVLRVHRRPIDRLVSLIYPVCRYQCTALECEWTGNLPRERTPGLATDTRI